MTQSTPPEPNDSAITVTYQFPSGAPLTRRLVAANYQIDERFTYFVNQAGHTVFTISNDCLLTVERTTE